MKQAIVVWVSIAMGYVAGVQQGKIENNFESKYPIGSMPSPTGAIIPDTGPISQNPNRDMGSNDIRRAVAEDRNQ